MSTQIKKTIIISAINFRNGGPLSVLQDCLIYANNYLSPEYNIIALVHKKELFHDIQYITFLEFPKSVKSYFYRLYYEYIHFKKLSYEYKPYLWLSLHDMTPNVNADVKVVYCHNPSPFYNITFKDFWLDPKFALFNFFYKYLYGINIQKNNFVLVQQEWIRKKFEQIYNLKNVIVAHPSIDTIEILKSIEKDPQKVKKYHFFFPTMPRVFKNIELICEAVKILNNNHISDFEVSLTIDGTENRYAKSLINNYKNVKNINFIGKQTREKVFNLYQITDCLIFPSKLETWGMPITEFKFFGRPMLLADLEYAHETAGNYSKTIYFDPINPIDLANKMEKVIFNQLKMISSQYIPNQYLYAENWSELFKLILDPKDDI